MQSDEAQEPTAVTMLSLAQRPFPDQLPAVERLCIYVAVISIDDRVLSLMN
jgi:hypothetical protein